MKKMIFMILGTTVTFHLSALEVSNLTTLSPQKGTVWTSRAAINHQGTATVVWIKSLGPDLYTLEASTRANSDSPWDPAQTISEPMKIATFFPSVADNGTATIIWGLNPQKAAQYYFAQKDKSSPWLQAEAIHYPGLSEIKDVTSDFKGDPVVIASDDTLSILYSYCYKPNEKPADPYTTLPRPSQSDEKTYAPLLLKSPKGEIIALWGSLLNEISSILFFREYVPKDYHFKASLLKDNGNWNDEIDVGRLHFTEKNLEKDTVKNISASINKENKIAIIWTYFDSESSKHQLKTIVQKCEVIKESQDDFTDSAILVDEECNAVAVWIEPFMKHKVVYAAFKPKDKPWQGVPQILSNINHQAEHVQLSFSKGFFVIVWGESDGVKKSIFGSTKPLSAEDLEWTPAIQLSPADLNCWYPSIAFGEKGGIITWTTHVKRTPDFQIQVANLTAP